MPGLMIAMALVLAPAVDLGLKDPWAAAPRASAAKKDAPSHEVSTGASAQAATERSPDLRDPFKASPAPPNAERSADLRNPFEAPPTPHSADLRDPFEAAGPHSAPPTPAPRSGDLRDPFEGKSPPSRPADRRKSTRGKRPSPTTDRNAGLVDPFEAATPDPVEPTPARSLGLRNPFAPRLPTNRRAR